MNKDYCYSHDEEHYNGGFPTLKEAIEMAEDSCALGEAYWVGESCQVHVIELLEDVDDMIDQMECTAYDIYGECAEGGFGNSLTKEKQLEIKQEIAQIFIKHGIKPQWHGVTNIQKFTYTADKT